MESLDFTKKLHDLLVENLKSVFFHQEHSQQIQLVALYGTMIELTGNMITLIDNKQWTGVPSIFRSFLEAFVEFKNLEEDYRYVYLMEVSYNEQWLKVLLEAKNNSNPFLKSIADYEGIDEQISDTKLVISNLHLEGYKPLNIFQKFEKAGMTLEYRSIYNFLSNDTHSNMRALINRHLELNGQELEVVLYKNHPIENYNIYILSTAEILLEASLRLYCYFDVDFLNEIEKLETEFREIYMRANQSA
jgi:hypothetical protein